MIDRLQTDEAGHAPIDVEDGGTVSILWENRFSDDSPLRNVVTFRVTPGLEALNRALQGLKASPIRLSTSCSTSSRCLDKPSTPRSSRAQPRL